MCRHVAGVHWPPWPSLSPHSLSRMILLVDAEAVLFTSCAQEASPPLIIVFLPFLLKFWRFWSGFGLSCDHRLFSIICRHTVTQHGHYRNACGELWLPDSWHCLYRLSIKYSGKQSQFLLLAVCARIQTFYCALILPLSLSAKIKVIRYISIYLCIVRYDGLV